MDQQKHPFAAIWRKHLPDIFDLADFSPAGSALALSPQDFYAAGLTQEDTYTFRLEVTNAQVTGIVSGSAPARDLAQVLSTDPQAWLWLQGKTAVFRLLESFSLSTTVTPKP